MRIVNKFKNLTGSQLLQLVNENGDPIEINGDLVYLVPRTLPFANQAEISSIDEATHISAQTRFMDQSILVRI